MLMLKNWSKENGFKSNEFMTFDNMIHLNEYLKLEFGKHTTLAKGSKGFTVTGFSESKDENGNPVLNSEGKPVSEEKLYRLYNIDQFLKNENVSTYVATRKEEKINYLKEQAAKEGKEFKEYPEKQKEAKTIECSSSKPAEYLGQYFAAVSMGANFKVSKEIADGFKTSIKESIFQINEKGLCNPFKLSLISKEANSYCKEFLSKTHENEMSVSKQQNKNVENNKKFSAPKKSVSNEFDMEL